MVDWADVHVAIVMNVIDCISRVRSEMCRLWSLSSEFIAVTIISSQREGSRGNSPGARESVHDPMINASSTQEV